MPRFVFQLEPVLGFRKRREDAQQVVLGAALAKLRQAERVCDDYFSRRNGMRDRILNHHAEMDTDELRMSYQHCEYLDRAIEEQQKVIAHLFYAAEEERAKLIVLTKEKKILETLKERRREAFYAEIGAAEQREGDDINARRYDRGGTSRETMA
jgi:flagellar export protein FliJ